MAVEARRGCGYRKVGGLYLCGTGEGVECCKMPIILHVCPTCNQGIKQSRGWQWIDPKPWIAGDCRWDSGWCPLVPDDRHRLGDKVGLIWIGTRFYPRPSDFLLEAKKLGISRRIQAVPKGFKLGTHWVFFAHPHVKLVHDGEDGEAKWLGGVFRVFKPTKIEKIVTQSAFSDTVEMDKLREQGITPVPVPDDDPHHTRGTVYDDEDDEQVEMNL
jgi:hypothetical protein